MIRLNVCFYFVGCGACKDYCRGCAVPVFPNGGEVFDTATALVEAKK
ncbi:hypothetical protein I8F73_02395 [Enterococcus faecalis]|nr:hypothetical protein [Enterococcus faecalis]